MKFARVRTLRKLAGVVLIFLLSSAPLRGEVIDFIAFGDSLTVGWPYFQVNGNGRQPFGEYPPRLESLFRSHSCSNSLRAFNFGNPGENSSQLLNRIPSVMNARPSSKAVLIWSGANDLYQGIGEITSVNFNLRLMIKNVLARGKEPIIATLSPNTNLPGANNLITAPTGYNARIKAEAKKYNPVIKVADQYAALAPNFGALNSGDGLHMNRTGYQVVAQTWFAQVTSTYCNNPIVEPNINITPALMLLLDNN